MGKDLTWPYLCVIGAGNMGGALLEGWLLAGLPSSSLIVVDPSPRKRARTLIEKHSLRDVPELSSELWEGRENVVLVMAVKPNQCQHVLENFQKEHQHLLCVLSVMAGVRVETLKKTMGNVPIIRTMPNLPCLVRKGMIAMYGKMLTPSLKSMSEQLMAVVGETLWLEKEEDMDNVTVLSGSGPAYLFYMMECLVQAAVSSGLERTIAQELIKQTVIGSARLLEENHRSPQEWRESVTSPGGVTEATLSRLKKGNLDALIKEAFKHGYHRSQNLG